MKARSLKIQSFNIPYIPFKRPAKIYPQLLLKGKWLMEAGFDPNTHVNVIVDKDRLIIEPAI